MSFLAGPIFGTILKVIGFSLPIPVWAILGGYLWLTFDKNSDIRKAVDRATTELVSGAEIEAEKAKNVALQKLTAELKGQNESLETANKRFSENLELARLDLENANEEVQELILKPVNLECVVDGNVFSILRNR